MYLRYDKEQIIDNIIITAKLQCFKAQLEYSIIFGL